MVFLYFILGAFLRRWYGGMFPEEEYPILGNRALQTAVMMLVLATCYWPLPFEHWSAWLAITLVVCWVQFQFWSRGHGACFDLGYGVYPPEPSTIVRYEERWYHKVCDKLLAKHKYGFLYDFLYMSLRYTCPMLLLALLSWWLVLVGFVVTWVYALCWQIKDREPWIFEGLPKWISSPTKWAELAVGGIVYASCYYIGWGQLCQNIKKLYGLLMQLF